MDISRKASQKMNFSRHFKNTTTRIRNRVLGTGPVRTLLPASRFLIDIPSHFIYELNQFFKETSINNLKIFKNYKVSQYCPLLYALPDGFQHILLSHLKPGGDERNEQDYTVVAELAQKLKFMSWLKEKFPNAFRVRLSLLKAGSELSWHIDTNTSVACRCSATLNENIARFEIKWGRRPCPHVVPMQLGQIHFTNTGWPHRVFNKGCTDRLNLVFGVPFVDIEHFFEKSEEHFF